MEYYHLITILILLTTLFTFLNHKFLHWPPTIAVTVLSLLVSLILLSVKSQLPHFTRTVERYVNSVDFNEVVINVTLGFLLFGAAFKTDTTEFRKQLKVIVTLAFFGTLVSTFIVSGLVYYAFKLLNHPLPFISCLLFGALISPTDPVAALGVLKKVGISKKLELQIVGESLINDGIAIVLFTTFLGIGQDQSGDSGNFLNAVWLFIKEAGGAMVFGGALGGAARLLMRWTSNYKVEIMITLSLVMGGYTLAKFLHVSPPLSMVIAGLICSGKGKKDPSFISHDYVVTFWELIEDLTNVILFLLIGIELLVIPINYKLVIVGLISIALVIISRYLSVFPIYEIFKSSFEPNSVKLLTWGALRGAISIALALSLPAELHRGAFLPMTYIIAIFSIIVQGLTLKPLALKLNLGAKEAVSDPAP